VRDRRVASSCEALQPGSNASLNAEWLVLKNTSGKKRSLKGWTIRDNANHVYTFGALTLAPGATVKVHTGKGKNTGAHRYWQQGWYVWNNTDDRARLRRADGTLVDTCSWNGKEGGTKSC
jgi:hypothetical protein